MAQTQGTTREWEVDLEQPVPIDPDADHEAGYAEVGVDNVQFVGALIEEATQIVVRLGGIVGITAKRVEYEPGKYATTGLHLQWDSYGGPAQRLPREQAAEPEPEAAAA